MTDGPETRHLHGTTIHDHPGGNVAHDHGQPGHPGIKLTVFLLLCLLFLGAVMSYANPHLNFPVVSQLVCSVKGDSWYGGGILGPPGCYAPTP